MQIVPSVSVTGSSIFNIKTNDLFLIPRNIDICNFADKFFRVT